MSMPKSMKSNLPRSRTQNIKGFTLLELLVVLAIVGIMAGTAVFLATPSASEEGRRLGSKTFQLMQKGRVSAMLQRKVYGIEVSEDNSEIRLVVLIEDRDVFGNSSLDDYDIGDDDTFGDDTIDVPDSPNSQVATQGILPGQLGPDGEAVEIISYEDHKLKADGLGLIIGQADSYWELADDRDVVEVPGKVGINFANDSPSLPPPPPSKDEDELLEEEEILPIVMFFPDGRLSNRGNFRFVDDEGEEIYSFTWTELGEFERPDDEK